MSDWDLDDLEEWDNKICELAKKYGLDWFPIIYETCDYYEMIGNMAYHGMPTHYSHWSYGKSFERTHQMYNLGAEGLPYELIINSDPSIAYLMRENPIYLQILIMAHCTGHSDFFKNNRLFQDTRPETVVSRFRNAKKRIQGYVEDPSIGIEAVELILDAAHTVQFHQNFGNRKKISHAKLKQKYTDKIKNDKNNEYIEFDIEKIPLEPEFDLLDFVLEHASDLHDWQRDVIQIVKDQAEYFLPQMQTKIMNEGWACFWHYKLIHELDLPQKYHIPFIKSHNQVVRPHLGGINPYHLGFYLFNKIEERHGLEECFIARSISHDVSFIREFLTEEDCAELNLFSYIAQKDQYVIDEISDDDGWKKIKLALTKNIGINSIPRMYVDSIEGDNTLVIKHEHDGRDLELSYADEVVTRMSTLWGGTTKLITIVEDEPWEI